MGIVLAVIALGFLAQRIFGGDSISLAEAREAIEEMPYKVVVAERPDDVLIGSARAPHGVIVHFAVSDSIDGRGIPARLRRLTHEPVGGGGFWVWDDSEFWFRHGTGSASHEAVEIAVGIEEALCRKATGDACPV